MSESSLSGKQVVVNFQVKVEVTRFTHGLNYFELFLIRGSVRKWCHYQTQWSLSCGLQFHDVFSKFSGSQPLSFFSYKKHRGMAQHSESSYEWAVPITSVLLGRAPGPERGEIYSHHHQACVRKETEAGSAEAVSKPAGKLFAINRRQFLFT